MQNIFYLIIVMIFFSCNREKEITLNNEKDSLSYAFGVNFASYFKQEAIDTIIRQDIFLAGYTDVIYNKNPKLTTEQATKILSNYFYRITQKENERIKQINDSFLVENSKKEGVQKLSSGLRYKIITKGKGKTPTKKDKVKIKYVGKFIDNRIFDSSLSQPKTFSFDAIIPGLAEGLQLMNVGSKYEFYIPYNLAYGENGVPGLIPPFSTLIFEVELVDIEK